MNFEKMIYDLKREHPVWAWFLARLAFSLLVGFAVLLGLIAMVAFFYPLLYAQEGDGIGAFSPWFWLPVIAAAMWMTCSIATYIWREVIE